MNILTKPVGEKDRKLIIHPKDAVLRSGMVRSANGDIEIVDPKAVKIKSGLYCIERKEQGHRHFLVREQGKPPAVYGRRLNVEKTYTNIYPKLEKSVVAKIWYMMPENTVFDFELCWPGHPDSEVTTAIKECPEDLHPYIFSVPILEGKPMMGSDSMGWFEGRRWLQDFVGKEYMTKGFKPIELGADTKESIKTLEALLNIADGKGWEGFVLKGMFCDDWWKLKGINEADVFVTGFKISTAETRKGLPTGVKIAVLDEDEKVVDMGNVAGFSLELMNDMKNNPEKYLNKVMRVVYQEIAGKGKMKHGFFNCWRDDKNWQSCSINQFQ
jgi:hypothetical protein